MTYTNTPAAPRLDENPDQADSQLICHDAPGLTARTAVGPVLFLRFRLSGTKFRHTLRKTFLGAATRCCCRWKTRKANIGPSIRKRVIFALFRNNHPTRSCVFAPNPLHSPLNRSIIHTLRAPMCRNNQTTPSGVRSSVCSENKGPRPGDFAALSIGSGDRRVQAPRPAVTGNYLRSNPPLTQAVLIDPCLPQPGTKTDKRSGIHLIFDTLPSLPANPVNFIGGKDSCKSPIPLRIC